MLAVRRQERARTMCTGQCQAGLVQGRGARLVALVALYFKVAFQVALDSLRRLEVRREAVVSSSAMGHRRQQPLVEPAHSRQALHCWICPNSSASPVLLCCLEYQHLLVRVLVKPLPRKTGKETTSYCLQWLTTTTPPSCHGRVSLKTT